MKKLMISILLVLGMYQNDYAYVSSSSRLQLVSVYYFSYDDKRCFYLLLVVWLLCIMA